MTKSQLISGSNQKQSQKNKKIAKTDFFSHVSHKSVKNGKQIDFKF